MLPFNVTAYVAGEPKPIRLSMLLDHSFDAEVRATELYGERLLRVTATRIPSRRELRTEERRAES